MKVINDLDIFILEEFSKDLTRKFTINELSKIINKHYRPTYAAVQRLIKNKFIIKNKNNLIEILFEDTILLELSERKRLIEHKNNEIKIISKKLSNINHSFFSAILFGSSVYKKGKDIDILVIIPDCEEINNFKLEIEKTLGSFYSIIDLNIINEKSCYEMLNKINQVNVMNEIIKNHLVLVGINNFYRIIKRWNNA
jgi:predicted nucleotidyltransferase